MEKIASFTIDHIKLQPGVYVSRKDKVGDSTVTTFDLRMTSPNEEPVMNTAEMAERQVPALPGSCPPYSYRSLYYDRPKGATVFDPIFYPND